VTFDQGGRSVVNKAHPEGMAQYYDDSWLQILASLMNQQSGPEAFTNLLSEFKGKPGDLERFLESHGARMAMANMLTNTPAYGILNDFNQDPTMQGLGLGLGQIGQAAEGRRQQIGGQLNRSGLGQAPGLRASLENQLSIDSATQGAGLRSQLLQQHYQNRMRQAQAAQDYNQAVTQLALGFQPNPRVPGGGGGGDWLSGLIAGAGAGAPLGPWGALAGGIVGGVGGALD
jgi:hypothetical protein